MPFGTATKLLNGRPILDGEQALDSLFDYEEKSFKYQREHLRGDSMHVGMQDEALRVCADFSYLNTVVLLLVWRYGCNLDSLSRT
jgi:hypothetical protein